MTLLELVMATALLAGLGTAAALLLRTSHVAWSAHQEDSSRLEAAHATLRHITRQFRQAVQVSVITPASNNSGSLTLLMSSGQINVWSHNPATGEVYFGVGSASDLLATGIMGLSFTAYDFDGVSQPSDVTEIQSIECRVQVQLPHDNGGARTISGRAWMRSW